MQTRFFTTRKSDVIDAKDLFFTSDTHFGHRLMTAVGKNLRGFDTTYDMDNTLIEEWNKVVPKEGFVFHLGDMFLTGGRDPSRILKQLNGLIYLLRGNHSNVDLQVASTNYKIVAVADYISIRVREHPHQNKGDMPLICMSHYPIESWDRCHYGSWMLHGHCHGNLAPTKRKRLDVGVDTHPWSPYSYQEIKEIMETRVVSAVDHH